MMARRPSYVSAFIVILCSSVFWVCTFGVVVTTIDNRTPRLDDHGNIMDAHDGSIQKIGNLYYMHAMQYGLCEEPPNMGCDGAGMPSKCGFQMDHNISIWSSPSLASGSWTYVGDSISVADRPAGVVFRPHLVYNPTTKMYVLFWNYMRWGEQSLYAVAASFSPAGPFKLMNPALNVTRGGGGDFDVLVNDDGKGYIIYSQNYKMSIEELTPDYYHSAGGGATYMFDEYFVEAPIFMKKGSLYYALFGWCCCYCLQGSGVLVHTATNPMGPYTLQTGGDLACVSMNKTDDKILYDDLALHDVSDVTAIPTPGQGCQYHNTSTTSIVRSQQNYIIKVTSTTGETTYIWTGDRWQQAPDHIKGHEPQYWTPITFNKDGTISKMDWIDTFTFGV
eukprot:TRINITY_DN2582_c0_g1_i6.p1 TRINITY_DN2582_c0_g1~~TRINITY_DN2582_c0_g1_i6.p1  ORF type:complete len:391 (-),score=89.02 TRINITY_DN2582_c0_g1_i6:82-1254(-)